MVVEQRNDRFAELDGAVKVLSRGCTYGSKGGFHHFGIEDVALPGDAGIVDQYVHVLVLVGNLRDKLLDAVALGHVELLHLNAGVRMLHKQFITGLLGELQIATGHDDLPAWLGAEGIHNPVADALVRASNDDCFGVLLHG